MSSDSEKLEVAAAARTDVGKVRSQNEDACLVRPEAGLFMAADGMGGHAAGEVASGLAVETVEQRLAEPSAGGGRLVGERGATSGGGRVRAGAATRFTDPDEAKHAVREAVEEANRRIHGQAQENPDQRGMGTTATVLLLPDAVHWIVGQVGDSRAYLWRGGELTGITTDHTVVPGSSTLTRALGTRPDVEVDILDGELRPGDVFLLCSDGLTDMMSHEDIGRVLSASLPAGDPARRGEGEGDAGDEPSRAEAGAARGVRQAADGLVEEVLDRGAHDNVTVVVVGV